MKQQEQSRAELVEERRNREILCATPPEEVSVIQEAAEYAYHLGDKVYICANEYEILHFDDERVTIYDTQFPLFNK